MSYYPYLNNPYQFNPVNYVNQNTIAPPSQALPQQQVIQVNGKASVDTSQLAPNSSVLVMDTSAPIVWLCVSDGVGRVTSTPYDITEHKDEPAVDTKKLEERVAMLENLISGFVTERTFNNEPNASAPSGSTAGQQSGSSGNNSRHR